MRGRGRSRGRAAAEAEADAEAEAAADERQSHQTGPGSSQKVILSIFVLWPPNGARSSPEGSI